MDLSSRLSEIVSREDLSLFICELLKGLRENPESWENADLAHYLEAMAAWVEDMDGYYANRGQEFDCERPTWRNFADILGAASIYE